MHTIPICGIFERHGWLRIFGRGIAWKPADAPMLFSQRNGYTKTYVLLGYRFHYLGYDHP